MRSPHPGSAPAPASAPRGTHARRPAPNKARCALAGPRPHPSGPSALPLSRPPWVVFIYARGARQLVRNLHVLLHQRVQTRVRVLVVLVACVMTPGGGGRIFWRWQEVGSRCGRCAGAMRDGGLCRRGRPRPRARSYGLVASAAGARRHLRAHGCLAGEVQQLGQATAAVAEACLGARSRYTPSGKQALWSARRHAVVLKNRSATP